MIHQKQHLTLTQPLGAARSAPRRRELAAAEDVLALLLLPLNLVIAIVAMAYWIIAAVIRGDDEG
jgi:hypothetical protein